MGFGRGQAGRLAGEIALATAPAARERLLAAATMLAPGAPLRIDCTDLEFIDSSGLSALLTVMEETGRTLHLDGVSKSCRRIFEIAGLDQLFEFGDIHTI